mgnify:CR=1 FL=1
MTIEQPKSKLKIFFAYDIDPEVKGESRLLSVVAFICIAFLAWAWLSELDRVVSSTGKTYPVSKLQSVEHFEGGRVEKILIREGDLVERNQVLITLSPIQAVGEFTVQKETLAELSIRQKRLEAEYNKAEVYDLPQELKDVAPQTFQQELELFEQRKSALQSELSKLESEIGEALFELKAKKAILDVARKELNLSNELFKSGLESEIANAQAQRQYLTAEADYQGSEHRLSRARDSKLQYEQSYNAELLSQLADVRTSLIDARQKILMAADKADRLEVRSPISGKVNNLEVSTIGSTVKPGETIAEIVPIGSEIAVEVHVSPADIGFVQVDQEVLIKFTAYDFSIFGALRGVVSVVPGDTIVMEDGSTRVYRVLISIPQEFIAKDGRNLSLLHGLDVQADIIVGKRSVLDYLISPLNRTLKESFRES